MSAFLVSCAVMVAVGAVLLWRVLRDDRVMARQIAQVRERLEQECREGEDGG